MPRIGAALLPVRRGPARRNQDGCLTTNSACNGTAARPGGPAAQSGDVREN